MEMGFHDYWHHPQESPSASLEQDYCTYALISQRPIKVLLYFDIHPGGNFI